jgi:hypothetical protein
MGAAFDTHADESDDVTSNATRARSDSDRAQR